MEARRSEWSSRTGCIHYANILPAGRGVAMVYRNKEQQKSPAKRFLFILGLVFLALYFVLGIIIILWKDIPLNLTQNYRIAFGVLLIVYAIIRFFRIIRG